MQRVWNWAKLQDRPWNGLIGRGAVVGSIALIVAAFIFFFPVLSAWPLTYNAWHARMWMPSWIVGPG